MKQHINWLFCVLMCTVCLSSRAQSDTTLTLEESLTMAFDQNANFASIQNLETIRMQNRKILRTALLPQLSASTDVNQFVQNSTVIFTDNILPPSEINGARTFGLNSSINSSLNLTNLGQAIVELKAQRYADEADDQSNQEEKNTIILLLCRTYFDCLLSQEVSQVIDEKLLASEQILQIASQRVELGEADSLEYYQALINYEQDANTRLSVNALTLETLNNLKILLGLNTSSDIALDTSIFLVNNEERITSASFHPDSTARVLTLQKNLTEMKIRSRTSFWDMLPDVTAFAGYGYSNQTFQNGIVQQNTALGFSYGLTVTYGFGNVKNAIHQNKIFKTQADNVSLQIRDEKNAVQSDYNLLKLRLEQLKQTITSNRTVLKMASRTLRNSLVGYEIGSVALADLRLAQDQYLNAQIELKRSMADLFVCQVELLALFTSLEETILKTL